MGNCWKHLENVWGHVGLKSIFFAFAADLKIRGATTWSGSDQCLVSAPCPLLSCLSPTLIRSLFRPRCCCCCLLTKYLLVEMRKRDLLNALNKLCYVSSYDKNNIFIARRYNTWNLERKKSVNSRQKTLEIEVIKLIISNMICQNLNKDEMENLLETKYQSITNEFLKIIYVGIVQDHT